MMHHSGIYQAVAQKFSHRHKFKSMCLKELFCNKFARSKQPQFKNCVS
jgi:hypothetical protein